MHYHHRSRLPPPPPPPPFGRGGGAGYPHGHKQLYAPPPPPPPQRRHEVLMEAGRLAAEYLVAKGVLPPSSLQRGSGGAWVASTTLPAAAAALPPQQQQEDPAFYGRKRYEDEYSNNLTRPRRNSSTSSGSGSSSSRDDYSSGSYNGRGKRKYGDYRRGYSEFGRERERERGRPSSNGRRCEENDDEDGAPPGFWRERRGSAGNDDARNSAAEAAREAMPLMGKELGDLEMKGNRSKAMNSSGDVKDADAPLVVQSENEDGEMEDGTMLSSEPELVKLGVDTNGDVNNASVDIDMKAEVHHWPDGKVPDEKAEDDDKVLVESALDAIALDDMATNLENNLHGDERNLLKYCDYAKAPTRARSLRAHRNATSVQREPAVPETADLVSSGEASKMVPDEAANESSMTNLKSENIEDQIYRENPDSSTSCNETLEPIFLKENEESAVIGNMIKEKSDAELQSKEEINVSLLVPPHKDNLMQETDLVPLTASHKDSLIRDNLSPLTDSHKSSLIEETESPLTHSHENSLVEETNLLSLTQDSLLDETGLSQAICSHESNLKLQFKEGCGIDMLPEDVDLIELSDQRKTVGDELCSNVGAEAAIKMEEENLDRSSPFEICNHNLIVGTEVSAIHNNPGLEHCSAEGSSMEPQKRQQQDLNAGGTDAICQLPLDSKAVQIIDIEDDTPIEVGGFDSSKEKSDIICSSMDNMVDPVVHSNDLPGIQDGYNLAISDYLGDDIPCYTSMQSDLHTGIVANDSEGIPVMDDPIYGSLTDIGYN
ncbi:hypothetical protein ABZP36_022137 [Zizania latifolia]